jgi:hypothetical protein
MNNPLKIYLGICFSVSLLFTPAEAQTELFQQLRTSFFSGAVSPRGDLRDVLEDRPVFGLQLCTPYAGSWKAVGQFQYSLLDGDASPRSVHYLKTGLGLAYEFPGKYLPVTGLGLANFFIRSAGRNADGGLLMDDNESEFGLYPFVIWNVGLFSRLSLHIGLEWDLILSEPEYTHLPAGYMGVGWRWW